MARRGKCNSNSERPPLAVFVDRDGTICFDKHYLSDSKGLEIIPTVPEGIELLNKAGLLVIIVTNQSGIARGYFTEDALTLIHKRLLSILAEKGAKIDDILHCPHMPGSGCVCRKPAPGMLLTAQNRYGLDLKNSYVIGDRMMDIEMAHSVGAKGVLVPEPGDQYCVDDEIRKSHEKPDYRTTDFVGAVRWVLSDAERKVEENE